MSGFDPDWLALRAPADEAARAVSLIEAAGADLAGAEAPLVCDLGAGTGAAVRAFGPHFPPAARWLLVDDDPACLAEAAGLGPHVATLQADLAQGVPDWPADCRLVTATAFFDLAGRRWIEALADRLAEARLPLLASLTYDGRFTPDPPHPLDTAMRGAFNRHQQSDKGLGGPACGPEAPAALAAALEARGYEVMTADSPWELTRERNEALMMELLSGIARAVAETGLVAAPQASDWFAHHRHWLRHLQVGHVDLYARPQQSPV